MRAFLLPLLCLSLLAGCRRDEGDGPFPVEDVAFDVPEGVTPYVPTLEGPLRVLSATPSGASLYLRDGVGVTVTFTRPMVPLGEADAPPDDALTLDPPVPGTLRWEGTQTLVFTPEVPLPSATAYRATLRTRGLQSLEGETLARDTTWTFETPRPRLVAADPADGERFADPQGRFVLTFNQPVRAARVAPYVAVQPDGGGALPRPDVQQRGDSSVVVSPARLSPGTTYTLTLREGLPSAVGPLPMPEDRALSFRVRPRLAFEGVSQETYGRPSRTLDPARGVTLTFSTPVRFGDLRKALRIAPAVEIPPGIEARDDATATTHALAFAWQPETTYEIRVEHLTDTFGQTLEAATRTFRTGPLAPAFRIPEGVMIVEARPEAAIPLRLTNTSEMRVRAEKLTADRIVPALLRYDRQHWYGQDERADPPAPTRTVTLDVPRNTPVRRAFRVDSLLRRGHGVVAFNVRDALPGRREVRDRSGVVQVTDLGLTAKFSPHQNLVFVTRLSTAEPVAGATVTLRGTDNRVRWEGQTDARGRAAMPGWGRVGMKSADEWSAPVQFVTVEKDGDLAFTSSVFTEGIEPYRFDLDYDWSPPAQTHAGTVFTDRGLYRAGETAHVKGILRVRRDGDWRVLRDSVRVLTYDARDAIVYDRTVRPSEMGAFDFALALSTGAAQGLYEVRVVAADDTTALTDRWRWRSTLASGTFRVDAFRTASFAVEAHLAAPSYVAGDRVDARVEGRYLFGAAMGGQPVRYRLTQNRGHYAPPGYESWRFNTLSDAFHDAYGQALYQSLAEAETTLDADGTRRFSAVAPGTDHGTALDLTLTATVTDPSRQELSDQKTVTLHPGLFYVGLKPRTTYLDLSREKEMPLDVLTVDPNGAPVSASVAVTLVKENWISTREVGVDGRLQWHSERRETPVGTQTITTQKGKAKRVRLPVEEGGRYLVRAEGQDVRGNVVRSEAYFYAAGGGYTAWERADDDRIDLVADKPRYAPGETARILVQSPYEEATALVTVEREGILESRVVTLRGTSPQVELKLTEAHLPNVFVSVMLLTGRVSEPTATADVGAPAFKIGYVTLPVDSEARHLRVEVEPGQAEYRPGEEVEVGLRLVDQRGRGVAGEITFSAADAGVLNLIQYALPDPYETFYGPRPLGVTTAEARANLIELRAFGQKEEDLGGGGGDAGNLLRKDFRPLAHWSPALRTDNAGRATVRFRVPERLTTFRLMAAAATADHRFGAGQKDIVVTQPLVLTPALPRFVRPGDRFEAGVLVTNRTGASGTAEVRVEAEALALRGPATQRVTLDDGATREVRFAFTAPTSGTPRLRFRSTLGRERDALQTDVPLQPPTTKEVTATFAATDSSGTAREALRLPDDVLPGLGFFEARLSSTALVGLDGATRYLFTYPYGCLEQRTSAIRPLLVGKNLLDAYDLSVLGGTADEAVVAWLASLDDFWTGTGFTMWRGEASARAVNPYVSAYVVLALAEAQAAGYRTPAPLTKAAVDWLDGYVRRSASKPDYYPLPVWNDTRALMLYALVRHGRRVDGELQALAAAPAGTLTPEGDALLLRALVATKAPTLARYAEPVAGRVLGRLRMESTQAYLEGPSGEGWGWIFASDARATAYGLAALAEARATPETRLVAQRMVAYLMATREGGAWASTQDNAAVVDAFAAFARAFEQETPDLTARVKLAGRDVVTGRFQGRTLKVEEAAVPLRDVPKGTAPVEVTASGRGRAYYSLRAETYRATPLPALAQGLTVERRIEVLDAQGNVQPARRNGDGNVEVEAGALVRVTLRLVSPTDRSYVVVDDALPAGLEALNAAFATTDQAALQNAGAGQNRWWGSFNHTELRDDRVLLFADYLRPGEHTYVYLARATTPGTFVHPAVAAEMMYRPEIRGRTAAATFVVRVP